MKFVRRAINAVDREPRGEGFEEGSGPWGNMGAPLLQVSERMGKVDALCVVSRA